MTATSKIVDEIIDRFDKEIKEEKEIPEQFRESLKKFLVKKIKLPSQKSKKFFIRVIVFNGKN